MIQSEAQEVLTTSKLRPKRPAVHNLDLMIGGKAKAGLRDYGKVPMQQQVGQRRPTAHGQCGQGDFDFGLAGKNGGPRMQASDVRGGIGWGCQGPGPFPVPPRDLCTAERVTTESPSHRRETFRAVESG